MGAGVALAIAGGMKLTQGVISGLSSRNQNKVRQYQLETQKKAIEANAANAMLQRLNNLNSILSTQRAVFASRGQSTAFGSAMVINQESMNQAAIEQQNENLQTELNLLSTEYNIKSAKSAASNALFNNLLGSALDFAGDAALMYATNSFDDAGGGKKTQAKGLGKGIK